MTRSVRVLGRLDPNFAWDGNRIYDRSDFRPGTGLPVDLRGAAASVEAGSLGDVAPSPGPPRHQQALLGRKTRKATSS